MTALKVNLLPDQQRPQIVPKGARSAVEAEGAPNPCPWASMIHLN